MLELLQNEYVKAGIIILITLALAHLFDFFIKRVANKLTGKTKTTIDDELVKSITGPLYVFIFVAGLYIALRTLNIIQPYEEILNKAYFVIAVLIATVAVAKVISTLITGWLQVSKKYSRTPKLINGVISVVIYILAIAVILEHFNIKITPFIAALGVGGLAVGLALQNTLTNLFAGLHIISDQPIRVGDFVHIDGDIAGHVEDIGWRSTRIRQLSNILVIVPNSKLAESTIINNTLPDAETSVIVQCGVAYGSNLEKVEKITIETAKKIQKTVEGAVKTHEPFIRYHTFADSNINFSIILRAQNYVDKFKLTHEFIKELKKAYDKNKIEISWPVRKIVKSK